MINVHIANSHATTLRSCAENLQTVINTINNSLAQISHTDSTTASPVRNALNTEYGKIEIAKQTLYNLADQIEADAAQIYQQEVEEARRQAEEEARRIEEEAERRGREEN